jgi:hypothetical protein
MSGSTHRSGCADVKDIRLIGRLDSGIGIYRFKFKGEDKDYVGVIAQDVLENDPSAVSVGDDGYLYVDYPKVGMELMTGARWDRCHA